MNLMMMDMISLIVPYRYCIMQIKLRANWSACLICINTIHYLALLRACFMYACNWKFIYTHYTCNNKNNLMFKKAMNHLGIMFIFKNVNVLVCWRILKIGLITPNYLLSVMNNVFIWDC